MSNKATSPIVREKVQNILITNYLGYAKALSNELQRNLRSKGYLINGGQDLEEYAIQGLVLAVRRFDGRANLDTYARKYILGQLYLGITDLSPLKQLSHYERFVKKIRMPSPHLSSDIWFYDKMQKDIINNNNIEDKIRFHEWLINLPAEYKEILGYRYDLITFKKKRTWSKVANIMGYTRETLRKKMLLLKRDFPLIF
uniref:Sigma-70 region domain containing protein n=1 Tax=viral metagenome TaxID=1070528 RepID=A0A6C0I524_9ZZZZ